MICTLCHHPTHLTAGQPHHTLADFLPGTRITNQLEPTNEGSATRWTPPGEAEDGSYQLNPGLFFGIILPSMIIGASLALLAAG